MSAFETRVFARLLRVYPAEFREQYGEDLMAFFEEDRRDPRYGSGWLRPVRFWIATLKDLLSNAVQARRRERLDHQASGDHQRSGGPAGRSFLSGLRLDLRDAIRALAATPGPTIVALVVLTLGIGASTAMFAVVDTVALRGLPFDDASSLVSIAETARPGDQPVTVAPPNFVAWTSRQQSFEALGASRFINVVLHRQGVTERLLASQVTPNLFGLLHLRPQVGRLFSPADGAVGAPAVVILSDGAWRRRFGADPTVIGQTLTFEAGPRQIVGVMPPGFVYPVGSLRVSSSEFWFPLAFTDSDLSRDGGRNYNLSVIGRLKHGATIDRARVEMQQIRDVLAAAYPRWFVDRGIVVRPAVEAVVGPTVRSWMLMLLGAVGLVLLIACVNVANVLLTRATSRTRELGIRAALGATRFDLLRGVLVESTIVGVAGAVLGLLIAALGTAALRATLPAELPRLAAIGLDARVVLVALVGGAFAGVLCGVLPAIRLSRPNLADTLHGSGRGGTATGAEQRLRGTLVVVEVSLAIVLLVGAGLFVSSFVRLLDRDLGFDPSDVITISAAVRPPASKAEADAWRPPDFTPLAGRIASVPGVEAVGGITSGMPLSGSNRSNRVTVGWRPEPFDHDDDMLVHEGSAGLLPAMRLTLKRGRWLSDTDTANAPGVVVLSEEASRRYFGEREALGQLIRIGDPPDTAGRPRRVVGIVADTAFRGPEAPAKPEGWIPLSESDQSSVDLIIRSHADLGTLVPAINRAIADSLSGAVIEPPRTFDVLFTQFVAARRFNAIIIAVFGLLAIAIVAVGIYGVMACTVDQRTREIGVRMALGAKPGEMLTLVLRRASVLALGGLVVGVALSAGLEQSIRRFLYQPKAYDPAVYLAAGALIMAMTVLAAAMPARRAASVDPLVALRRD